MLDKTTKADQNGKPAVAMRIRAEFAKTEAMRFTSHLDLYRAWERLLRRAGLPLQFSQGYNPRPKLQLAAPLPLGMTSQVEIIDFWLSGETYDLDQIHSLILSSQPPGIDIRTVEFVDPTSPPLQQEVSAAEYEVIVLDQEPLLNQKVASLLEAESIIRQRRNKSYDLRPLILELSTVHGQSQSLQMRLSAMEGSTGRPEEVLLALEIQPEATHIERTRLVFK
jgi:radical SAM-linked protein